MTGTRPPAPHDEHCECDECPPAVWVPGPRSHLHPDDAITEWLASRPEEAY